MKQFIKYVVEYFSFNRYKSFWLIILILLSGLLEGIGLMAFFPVINMILYPGKGGTGKELSFFQDNYLKFFDYLHIENTLGSVLFSICILIIIKTVFLTVSLNQVNSITLDYIQVKKKRFIELLFGAKWTYFIHKKAGDIATSIMTEADRASSLFSSVGFLLAYLVQILAYIVVSFAVSPSITMIGLVISIFILVTMRSQLSKAQVASEGQTNTQVSFSVRLIEALAGMKIIKAMNLELKILNRLNITLDENLVSKKKISLAGQFIGNAPEPIQVICMSIGLWGLLKYSSISPESIIILAMLFYRTMQRISVLQKYYQTLLVSIAPFEQMEAHLNSLEKNQEHHHGKKITHFNTIEFKDLKYVIEGNTIFNQFNLSLPSKGLYFITGPSGRGKTTLVDLLINFKDVTAGSILVDQVNIKDVEVGSWRNLFGYVGQETFLFNDTLLNNITLNDDQYSEEEIKLVLEKTQIGELALMLPQGLNSSLGESGGVLSGGQKQRVALARAIIKKPKILILDEVTSALDAITVKAIVEMIVKLKNDHLILFITHNKEITQFGDKVIEI